MQLPKMDDSNNPSSDELLRAFNADAIAHHSGKAGPPTQQVYRAVAPSTMLPKHNVANTQTGYAQKVTSVSALQIRAQHNVEEDIPTGRRLRSFQQLKPPEKALRNVGQNKGRRELSRVKTVPKVVSDAPAAISQIKKDTIATQDAETKLRQSRFLIAHKDLFLPLIPESNHLTKLIAEEEQEMNSQRLVAYEQVDQPEGIKVDMKPYQLRGLSFLVHLYRNGMPAILGDEMGLGKTGQTISLLQWLKETRHDSRWVQRPSLVIVPLSILNSWTSEIGKWAPGITVLKFHGPSEQRSRLKKIALGFERPIVMDVSNSFASNEYNHDTIVVADKPKDSRRGVDVVITTYETFISESTWFKRCLPVDCLILDEGHKIKNAESNVAKALQGLKANCRLVLTGTPIQNNLVELWALLHWILPNVFTNSTLPNFQCAFNVSKAQYNRAFIDHACRLLELLMLRRMKNTPGVNLNLPPKTDVLLFAPLTPMQRSWYMRLLSGVDETLLEDIFKDPVQKDLTAAEKEEGADSRQQNEYLGVKMSESTKNIGQVSAMEPYESNSPAWQKLMNLVIQLRKLCNHPYLLPDAAPTINDRGSDEYLIIASGKLIILEKLVQQLVVKEGKKILIFSCFIEMLNIVEELLLLCGGDGSQYHYLRLDGSTGRARRNLNIRMFNDLTSDYQVMLLSTRAGGLGINLTSASDVVLLDMDWNPQVLLQAENRSHRIGQTRPVTIYKLCTQGTVEEQMLSRLEKKLYLSIKMTESLRDTHVLKSSGNGGESDREEDVSSQLGTAELMSLVRRGTRSLMHEEISPRDMRLWNWETMLEHCKDNATQEAVPESYGDREGEAESEWLAKREKVRTQIFEGKKVAKQKRFQDSFIVPTDVRREERRVGKNTTVMIDGYAVSKYSANCAQWEAVPTMAGKGTSLKCQKRVNRAAYAHQEHCQICFKCYDLEQCAGCPRSYHSACLNSEFRSSISTKPLFYCPQHRCADCQHGADDAGGMLYRCRYCVKAFCEDCLDWNNTELLGDVVEELQLLGFGARDRMFFIKCAQCYKSHAEEREKHAAANRSTARIQDKDVIMLDSSYAEVEIQEPVTPSTTAGSSSFSALTSPTTPATPLTPSFVGPSRKRKAVDCIGID